MDHNPMNFPHTFLTFALLGGISCSDTTPTTPTAPVSDGDTYFAVDFDGDGTDELAAIKRQELHWSTQQHTIQGGLIAHATGRLGTDPRESLILLLGRTRNYPEAKPEIIRVDQGQFTRLYIGANKSERFSDVRIGPKGVFATRVGSDKVAIGGWIQDGSVREVTHSIMGLRQAPLSDGSFVIGRLYGDEPRAHGGLEIHRTGQKPQRLPGLRGVRSLEIVDLDRDGQEDLLVADGWHFRYGKEAQARLVLYRGPDFSDKRLIAELDHAYTIDAIDPIQTASPHPQAILVTTDAGSSLLVPDATGWRTETIERAPKDAAAIIAGGPRDAWIMVNGASKRHIKVD
jgi:hypothetical protein